MKKRTEIRAKDGIIKTGANGIKVPKLKGKFSIELFDAETGRLDRKVESENLVTNAVRDIFAANNLGLTDYSSVMPLSTKLFGGILCFANTITEDADNYYLPKSSVNPIVAHAGQNTYSSASADTTRGEPNDVESGVITDGYKHVWEFATTQGNGTIAALGLCPADLGDWAMRGGSNFYPFYRLDMRYRDLSPRGHRCPAFFDSVNNRAFAFLISGSSLTVREFSDYGIITDIGINQCAIKDNAPLVYTDHTYTISNADRCYLLFYQGNIYVMYASGTTIARTIINTSTWETSSDSITATDANIAIPLSTTTGSFTDIDDEGYVYFLGANSKFYKVNFSNTDVIAIDRVENDTNIMGCGGFACFGKYCHVCVSTTGYLIEGNTAHVCAASKGNNVTYDARYIVSTTENGYASGMLKNNLDLVRTIGWTSYIASFAYGEGYANALSKLFLSTIKNLDNPVTKTATQTMKITYSIIEVSENEET